MAISRQHLTSSFTESAISISWAGDAALKLIRDLYPICRSITGAGLRATLHRIAADIPLTLTEVPSGTQVFDWIVPKEWNIQDAFILDARGERVVDFKRNNLHVVSYSVPVRATMTLEELRKHLFTLPARPDWIPYRTTYYRETWGFCISQRQLETLKPGLYDVVIDSTLKAGSLTYGECVLPGASDREVLVFTHCCHPSLCNDNLTGMGVATLLARYIAERDHRFTYRFVFAPATIGSITWLAQHEDSLGRIEHGLIVGLLGDSAALTYKKSRDSNKDVDRIAEYVLTSEFPGSRIREFSPYGYDERQFCSPGINLPVGRLTRSSNGEYDCYHTSADDLSFVSAAALAEAFLACLKILSVVEGSRRYLNLSPKGEPRLGKRGLYGSLGGGGPNEFEHALLWVLNQSDGTRDLVDVAQRSGMSYALVRSAADALLGAGLLAPAD